MGNCAWKGDGREDVRLCLGIEKTIVNSKTNKHVLYSLSKQTDRQTDTLSKSAM